MKKEYFTLVVKWDRGEDWCPEFGDYDRDVVRWEQTDSYYDAYATKIIKTSTDDQAEIDAAIRLIKTAK